MLQIIGRRVEGVVGKSPVGKSPVGKSQVGKSPG